MRKKINEFLCFCFAISFIISLTGCNKQVGSVSDIKVFHEPSYYISYVLDMAATTIYEDTLLYQNISLGNFEITTFYDVNSFNYKGQFINAYNKAHDDLVDFKYSTATINIEITQYTFPYQLLLDKPDKNINKEEPDVKQNVIKQKATYTNYTVPDVDSIIKSYDKFKTLKGGFFYITKATCYIYEPRTHLLIDYKKIICINSCVLDGTTKGAPGF